jgi:hypothetical protein
MSPIKIIRQTPNTALENWLAYANKNNKSK